MSLLRHFAFLRRRADGGGEPPLPASRDSLPPSPAAAAHCGAGELEQQAAAAEAAAEFHEVDLGGRCGGGSSGIHSQSPAPAPARTARARHAHPLALRCACLAAPLE